MLPSSPSKETTAFGEGLYRGVAGKVHSFTIEPKDIFGNRLVDITGQQLDQFQATAELVDSNNDNGFGNSLIPVIISYNDRNTWQYDASWTPRRAGIYQLNVTLEEGHIFGSPFLVNTEPSLTFAPESIAIGGDGFFLPWMTTPCSSLNHGIAGEPSSFTIQAFDAFANMRNVGGDEWDIVVASASSDSSTDYTVGRIETDYGNGTYVATVTPLFSGVNDLHISLNGSPLKGSPFKMDVIHGSSLGSPTLATE